MAVRKGSLTSIILIWVLLVSGVRISSAQASDGRNPTVKERVRSIPMGAIVEVRTRQKEKLQGRIGAVTDDGFVLQVVRNDKVQALNLTYLDVKSIVSRQRISFAQASGDRNPTVKERVLSIPMGADVEIRTGQKEALQGRMGAVTDDGFVLQVVRNDKAQALNLAYSDVKSIKNLSEFRETKSSEWLLVKVVVAIGAVVIICLAKGVTGA